MINIGLYLATLVVYFWAAFLVIVATNERHDIPLEVGGLSRASKNALKKAFIWLVFLCLPVNINGNVFTVFGNAVSDKSICSVWSLYQNAGKDALSVIAPVISQKAGEDASSLVGLVARQEAGHDANLVFGLVAYQRAKNDSSVFIGASAYQKTNQTATVGLGIAGYQTGLETVLFIGLAGYQNSVDIAGVGLGLVGFQNSQHRADTLAAMALYQRAGSADRAFAVWSELKASPTK